MDTGNYDPSQELHGKAVELTSLFEAASSFEELGLTTPDELAKVIETVKPCKTFIKAGKKDADALRGLLDFELIPPYNWGGSHAEG